MGYIEIPVYMWDLEFDPDGVTDWFADIHTDSKIDFTFDGDSLCIINRNGERLYVYHCDRDSLFQIIEPKSPRKSASYWGSWIQPRCKDTIEMLEKNLTDYRFTDRELYNLYLNSKAYDKFSEPSWFVGDIRLTDSKPEMDDEDYKKVLFCVSMEIRAEESGGSNDEYRPIKHEIEDRLVRLYRSNKDILIPESKEDRLWRKMTLGKMIISLKGNCDFSNVDALTLRREHILKTKYPWLKNTWCQYPQELDPKSVIKDVTYDFPVEESWADVINAMGAFTPGDQKTLPHIQICVDNIIKTATFMRGDSAFQRDIMNPLKVFGKEDDVIDLLSELVVAHELGHMTFRQIRNKLSLRESESLANWFSCVVADTFSRTLAKRINSYQSEGYQDFIEIPEKLGLQRKQYQDYCERVRSLLRSW